MARSYPGGIRIAQNGVVRTSIELIVDDFEHNDETLWTSDGSGTFDITSTSPIEDTYSARLVNTKRVVNHPNDGTLDYHPQAGDKWSYLFRPDDMSGQARLRYGRDTSATFGDPECFEIQMYGDGRFSIEEKQAGNTIASDTVDWTLSDVHEITVFWEHPDYTADHRLELRNVDTGTLLSTISGDNIDHAITSGGVEMYTNDGADSNFDQIQIEERHS